MARTKPTPKAPSRDFTIVPKTGKVYCFNSKKSTCTVRTKLWEARASDVHDAELQTATQEINEIIERTERRNRDASRHLHFVHFHGGLMLVWCANTKVVSSSDSRADIAKALRVKGVDQH
jgi:hypothetical protein